MDVIVKALEREFKYNDLPLTDPCPTMSPIEVLKHYSNIYPELVNSSISGPVLKNDKSVYEFKVSIGTKG